MSIRKACHISHYHAAIKALITILVISKVPQPDIFAAKEENRTCKQEKLKTLKNGCHLD